MDDFLDKLAEDQRRMRKFLRSQGSRFMKIGKALAVARERASRIFIVGEPPLDGFTNVIADEYLVSLPAVALRLEDPVGPRGPEKDESGELEPTGTGGPPLIARHLSRHFRSGDVLLVIAHSGEHPAIKALMGFAKLKGVYAILLGGLDAREQLRKAADTAVTLPTKGVKTVCEASLIAARILARTARAQVKEAEADTKLIRVECGACHEPVFVEDRYRGKKGICPLCRATLRVPENSGERASPLGSERAEQKDRLERDDQPEREDRVDRDSERTVPAVAEATSDRVTGPSGHSSRRTGGSSRRKPKKPLKQSVLNLPVPPKDGDDDLTIKLDSESEAEERRASERAAAIVHAAGEATSTGDDLLELDESAPPPPVGLTSKLDEPAETVIAPEDVAFDELAAATESADPFALPDAFVADLVMPQGKGQKAAPPQPSDGSSPIASGSADATGGSDATVSSRRIGASSRLVSNRFTVQDCRLRFGRGGYPDDTSPEHPLEALSATGLVFSLDSEDDLGSTLENGDELWVRLSVPAFLEPVLVRGTIVKIGGSTGGRGGTRIELEWKGVDPAVSRKLARAAETLATA